MKSRYRDFIESCRGDTDSQYALTPGDAPSPFALCFAIFGLWLLRDSDEITRHRDNHVNALIDGLDRLRTERGRHSDLTQDKPYLQLLTFSLSAFQILGALDSHVVREHVLAVIPEDIPSRLEGAGVYEGQARSGNTAMFWAILLLHAKCRYGRDVDADISAWVESHIKRMNTRGFWGQTNGMSHLQFQNGYHQYEIFEYLEVANPGLEAAIRNVASLADAEGHFAPYPGGGGCYDYDAVHILTSPGAAQASQVGDLLYRTFTTIIAEQNIDGGFAESIRIRPRSVSNALRALRHIYQASGPARLERLRYCLTLQRPKHDLVLTHWSTQGRGWGQSNLWDAWFRMLTLARIEVFFAPDAISNWGFIDYPGIGFNRKLRADKQ